jgi:hypothetical protein
MFTIQGLGSTLYQGLNEGIQYSFIVWLVSAVALRYFRVCTAPLLGLASGIFIVGFVVGVNKDLSLRLSHYFYDYLKDDYWINLALLASTCAAVCFSSTTAFILGLSLGFVGASPALWSRKIQKLRAA